MADDTTFQPVKQYLVSERQVRALFALSFVGMALVLLVLLFLASARPQARYEARSGVEFRQGLARAAAQLEGFEVYPDGRARLDIARAMELVVERGVADPGIVMPSQGSARTE